MSFQASAEDISLDGSVLKARLFNAEGEAQDAEIDLNDILGNENGTFSWGSSGFADSVEEYGLNFEGDDNLPILRARLLNEEGEAQDADVNLSERIANHDGGFHFE